jgi:Cu+-exporting ATPase
MPQTQIEIPVRGMDCAECTQHVQRALAALPGVQDVRVLLSSEKVILQVDPTKVSLATIRKAVEGAGYTVPDDVQNEQDALPARTLVSFTRPILTLFGLVFGAVLLVVIVGEWLGLFERVTDFVPWYFL